jgi:UDP-N-acetylglucosamine 4,6-dehydratase
MKLAITDSVLAITGGTGSFGATMVRHALSAGAREVRVFSRDEAKQDQMRLNLKDERVRFFLGDVRDPLGCDEVMRGVDFAFHAAALKQVPSCEFFPLQAVATNVQGSANVLRAAIAQGVKSVVCLSTDKAVYPINAMGMTKALMEKTALSFARDLQYSGTRVAVTRYGNVMYSRGSVIPLFVSQMLAGTEVTVTDPSMTRFLMSLSDSVELVNYAFEFGESGDLLVKKAPAATVEDLVLGLADVLRISNPRIKVIGSRHGEKLYESLLGTEEMLKAEDLGGYYRVPIDSRSLDYSLYFEEGQTRDASRDSYHSHNAQRLDRGGVAELLRQLPEIQTILKAMEG